MIRSMYSAVEIGIFVHNISYAADLRLSFI